MRNKTIKITTNHITLIIMLTFIVGCPGINLKGNKPAKRFDLLSEKEEAKFGHYVDACIQKDFLVLSPGKNVEVYQAIEEIGQALIKVSDRPDLGYTFKILITDLVNAFAGPGGYVYITTGLLEYAKTKDEIAGVIAHELGHISARHVVKHYRNLTYAQTLQSPLIIGGKLIGLEALESLSQFTALFFLQGYSRDYERQADYLAVKYLSTAHYDPQGMVSFLKRIWEGKEQGEKKGIDVFFSSHPETLERIKDIENYIKELNKREN